MVKKSSKPWEISIFWWLMENVLEGQNNYLRELHIKTLPDFPWMNEVNDVIKMIARVISETFFCLPKSIIGIVQNKVSRLYYSRLAANFDILPSGITCIKNGLLMSWNFEEEYINKDDDDSIPFDAKKYN